MKLVYFLFLILVLSCSKKDDALIPEQDCGTETKAEFIIHNYEEFAGFDNKVINGDAEYYSHYKLISNETALPGNFLWGIQVKLSNICVLDKPNIEFSVFLHKPDSLIIPEATIWEGPTFILIKPLASSDQTFYHEINEYNFHVEHADKAASLIVTIFFPMISQGSFSADSAYFFSNLDYMSCKITAHKPK